jgi:AraC-like DNA-binding protein
MEWAMKHKQAAADYSRIERAIHYSGEHHHAQPFLDKIAAQVQMSPFHLLCHLRGAQQQWSELDRKSALIGWEAAHL